MIDKTDRRLTTWVSDLLSGVPVSLDPPKAGGGKTVSLYLIELVHATPDRGTRRPPFLMKLRYLVTPFAEDALEAHRMLGTLVVAALDNPEFEVEQEPIPVSLWSALDLPPRPAFVIRVPFKHERPEKLAPPVKQPLVVKRFPLRSFEGRIVGPENIPLMNARVDLPALDLSTSTDSKGRFYFSSVPDAPGARLLRVRAKGQEFSIKTERAVSEDEPLVIQLELEG